MWCIHSHKKSGLGEADIFQEKSLSWENLQPAPSLTTSRLPFVGTDPAVITQVSTKLIPQSSQETSWQQNLALWRDVTGFWKRIATSSFQLGTTCVGHTHCMKFWLSKYLQQRYLECSLGFGGGLHKLFQLSLSYRECLLYEYLPYSGMLQCSPCAARKDSLI